VPTVKLKYLLFKLRLFTFLLAQMPIHWNIRQWF